MLVKDLIKRLEKLDQDREVFYLTDHNEYFYVSNASEGTNELDSIVLLGDFEDD